MDERSEMQSLREELERAGYQYYVKDDPILSDYDYVHKMRRLEELEARYPDMVTPDSPTQRVGGQALESYSQEQNKVPL